MQAAIRRYHNGAIPTTLESCQSVACYLPIIRYVSIFKFWCPSFTLYSLPNWHLYFIIIRHFLYYYLNGSYRGNSWTSGLPIRQSFFAVYSGLYFSNNTHMSYFIIVMFGPSPPLILKSLNSLVLSVSHDQIDRLYMVLD